MFPEMLNFALKNSSGPQSPKVVQNKSDSRTGKDLKFMPGQKLTVSYNKIC